MKIWLRAAAALVMLFVHGIGFAAGGSGVFTPTDLNTLARVSDPQVSPDGRYTVFTQRETDFTANRGRTDLWLVDMDAATPKARRITQHSANDNHPRWSADGASIYFLSTRAGSSQIWRLPLAGGEAMQITDYPRDIGSFKFSPDGKRIALSMNVPRSEEFAGTHDLRAETTSDSKVTARSYDGLFVRHWDTWGNNTRSNLFVAAVNADGRAGTPINVSYTLDADVPSKPDGGDEEFTFSPNGSHIVFAARVAGREESWSTNFDLYEMPAEGRATPKNLTAGNPAWHTQPVFLKNGDLAWLAMKRPGFEADRFAIRVSRGGAARNVAPDWDRSVSHLEASRDGRSLLATANDLGQTRLFAVDVDKGRVTPLTDNGTVGEFSPAGGGAVILWHDLGSPPDLYHADG